MTKRIQALSWTLPVLLLAVSLLPGGCHANVRAGYNDQDLAEAQKVAEQFLQHLKDQRYDAAWQLGAPRFKSLISQQSLQEDIQGRQQGGAVQNWLFKSSQIKEGIPRYILLLYHVQGSKVSSDTEFTLELSENPYQWRIWSVRQLNDAQAEQHAQKAHIVAEQFLKQLQAHQYAAAHQLLSSQDKSTTVQKLQDLWQETEQRRGVVLGWTLEAHNDTTATITGPRQSYTMLIYRLRGLQSNGGIVFTMIQSGSAWRIAGFQLRDSLPGIP